MKGRTLTTVPVSRTRRPEASLDELAPVLPWPELFARLKSSFRQGDHVTAIGPTGCGKTHIALAVAEIRSHVMVVACKPKDPLVDDAVARGYYRIPGNELEIPYVDGRPMHKRVVYWPMLPAALRQKLPKHKILGAEKAIQAPLVGGAIGYVRNAGHWCLVIDEGTWVCRDLKLQRDIDSALFQFRSLNASIIILGQRPAWMGRYVLSQPTHLFLFNTNDRDDRKALGDVSGVDSRAVETVVQQLDQKRHEFLYIDTRDRKMFRSVAPARVS